MELLPNLPTKSTEVFDDLRINLSDFLNPRIRMISLVQFVLAMDIKNLNMNDIHFSRLSNTVVGEYLFLCIPSSLTIVRWIRKILRYLKNRN